MLNQILADTMTLRDLYKKHHWQVAGPTFYQLHLLFDKHFEEQSELVDALAERIQLLGGISIAMAHDVAETTCIARPPKGREDWVEISRLLVAHELILKQARTVAKQGANAGDDGTNDLLVSDVVRTNELQVWFMAEHLVDVPVCGARGERQGSRIWIVSAIDVRPTLEGGMHMPECTHLNQVRPVKPHTKGCEECLKMGDTWVHLRLCLECGHVGCCDSSKNKHATKHFHSTKHPIMKSIEPGETWGWCYIDEVELDFA